MKKYELVGEFEFYGRKFFQIKALISFGNVSAGDLGGYIEKEENLSQSRDAWVYGSARVFGNAMVSGDAIVYGNARVFGNARVSGDAIVYGNAMVYGNARVNGNARVYGDVRVYDDVRVFGNARVFGDALVYGDARVFGNARVAGYIVVYGGVRVSGNARVYGNDDVMWISKIGSRSATLTIFKTKDGFKLATGCFSGTFEEFKNAVSNKKEDDKYRKEYESLYDFIELRFGNKRDIIS